MNVQGTFQCIVNWVFLYMLNKNTIVYLDDFFIVTKNEEEHMCVLVEVFCYLEHNSLFDK